MSKWRAAWLLAGLVCLVGLTWSIHRPVLVVYRWSNTGAVFVNEGRFWYYGRQCDGEYGRYGLETGIYADDPRHGGADTWFHNWWPDWRFDRRLGIYVTLWIPFYLCLLMAFGPSLLTLVFRRDSRKTGRCVCCKYDTTGLARCPECGMASADH